MAWPLLNALLVRVADAVMTPLAALPPAAGVVLLALVTALAILGLMRLTSDQAALAAVKRQIHADLFEMRLFNDDLRGLLRAQWAVLVHNARYLRLSLAAAGLHGRAAGVRHRPAPGAGTATPACRSAGRCR